MTKVFSADEKVITYRFHPQRRSGGGYYELVTKTGKFLGNVPPEELHSELREYEEQGYSLQ